MKLTEEQPNVVVGRAAPALPSRMHDTMHLLLQNCYLQCNPSSWHVRLLSGAQNHEVNMQKLEESKGRCVEGCIMAAEASMSHSLGSQLPGPAVHSIVLDKETKQQCIIAHDKVTDSIKEDCHNACIARCKGYKAALVHMNARPGRHPIAYDDDECALDCTNGCKAFADFLQYSG